MKTCKGMAITVKKKIWKDNKATHGFVVVGSKDDMLPDGLNTRSMNRIVQKIVTWLAKELGQCTSLTLRWAILEKVLTHEAISTLLPKYYPRLHEAKVQLVFLKNF
jgi:hypothetical protein